MAFPELPGSGFGTVQLSLSLAHRPILRDVDFHIIPGEIQALIGKQNEGKSVFCRVLTGQLAPQGGYILAGGRPYRTLDPDLARDLGIEMVGNVPKVFPALSVGENLYTGFGKWWHTLKSWWHGFAGIRDWLASFSIQLPFSQPLSRLRREDWLFVELLNRLYRKPRLLLLDETLEQLTPRRQREIMTIVRSGLKDGMAVLWVTHNIEDALKQADRVTVFRQGRNLFTGHARDVDRATLLRLCFSELEGSEGDDITREQFYEFMSLIEAMLRDLPAALMVCDLLHRVRFVNQSAGKLFPDAAGEKGMLLQDYFGTRNRHLAELAGASLDSAHADREWHSLPVHLPDGEDKLVDMRTRVIQERNVRIGCMILLEDVTSREKMRQSLALSENLASIGLLAAGVAHEVNDPLAIISNYLGFIRHEAAEESVVRSANLASEETVRIQQIVDNLVAFSGNRAPDLKSVDIMALARELCRLLRFHTSDRNVRFICTGPEEELFIHASQNEMRQVLLNLFRNSLDAIPGNGEIQARGEPGVNDDGDLVVRLIISDTGHGIKLKNPEDIFKPFVTTKKGAGTHQGLGLSIVYSIVEKYGGSIRVRNLPAGGSEFVLEFPYEREMPEE